MTTRESLSAARVKAIIHAASMSDRARKAVQVGLLLLSFRLAFLNRAPLAAAILSSLDAAFREHRDFHRAHSWILAGRLPWPPHVRHVDNAPTSRSVSKLWQSFQRSRNFGVHAVNLSVDQLRRVYSTAPFARAP